MHKLAQVNTHTLVKPEQHNSFSALSSLKLQSITAEPNATYPTLSFNTAVGINLSTTIIDFATIIVYFTPKTLIVAIPRNKKTNKRHPLKL
ncbi:MAG: hypothetical protein ACXITV_09645 [Luteibaculaceae bacterium]